MEGNTTFYSVPNAETVARWAKDAPPGFEFCLKLPKSVTHNGLLAPSLPGAIAFLNHMQGLGDRLGPMFAQLPPSYGPANLTDLSNFLQGWTGAELALEVRHPDWFKEPHNSRLNALLEDLGMGRVILDTRPIYECEDDPQLHSERKKPSVPVQPVVTAPFSLIRFISHPTLEQNQSYLEEWVRIVDRDLKQGTRVYFFVHCPVEDHSPTNARYFQQMLEQANVPVPPLLWNAIDQPPAQLTLF